MKRSPISRRQFIQSTAAVSLAFATPKLAWGKPRRMSLSWALECPVSVRRWFFRTKGSMSWFWKEKIGWVDASTVLTAFRTARKVAPTPL